MRQITVDAARWSQDSEGAWLCLRVKSPEAAMEVCDALKPGKEYTATIKGKGRSLDANGYAWVLLDKLAAHYGVSREKVYRQEIQSIGGVSEVLCLREKAAYGSSVYDTEQMARLIDAIVQDCRDVGIETMTPRELDALVSRWGEVSV